ncbi:MAG: hypothetical protein N2510_04720 [Ignavibacteria bacterium]|nr:hypothetical protein [Ignavibacteria bacterium]
MRTELNLKFILKATFVFIIYTFLSFLWHNNIFPYVYFNSIGLADISDQNIWAMNFANALLVYGLVYFTMKINYSSFLICFKHTLFYLISAYGFFSFMNYGIIRDFPLEILIFELLWIISSGTILSVLFYLTGTIYRVDNDYSEA